ncbi:MAG: SAM-dependent methyltransferase, partial [Clostridia bacterium]|nr:SAM-dependent methyltransferase [Clostridia bacterium]
KPQWQAEQFKDKKVFHRNIDGDGILSYLQEVLYHYGQVCVFAPGQTATLVRSRDGEYRLKTSANMMKAQKNALQNDRKKDYILKEGEQIPALVDLGVFTKDFKVVNGKYDKYKQINRFVELIDDAYADYKGEELTILDFGCGKSYLTFIVYYYFVKLKGIRARIIGYDLKADVVENCNALARRYGYDGLEFVVSDVTKDVLYGERIDMIISLHACDVATDYALHYAIQKNVKNIFSVPCCQHEVNSSIHKGGELDVFLRYGIIKERMSALLTDSIRAMVLEDMGYSVDVIEFVDLSHSPKNIMLRAKYTGRQSKQNRDEIKRLTESYGIKQTLYELTKNY